MNHATLTVRGHTFTIDALRTGIHLPDATENEAAALAFCADWLSGVAHFTLHTSGSTGEPKPINLTRRQMEASALATAAAVGLQPSMTALVCLPTRYIAGRMMLVRGILSDLHMTLVEPTSNPLAQQTEDFDFAALVPLQIEAILDGDSLQNDPRRAEESRARLNRAHALLIGGAPLSTRLESRIRTLDAPCYHTYGMTETVSHVALRRINGATHDNAFVALPGVEIAIDERDCLRVRGPMTEDLWIQTNDIVRLLDAQRFIWLGRADNIINSGGIKTPVEQLERAIEPALQETFVEPPRFFVAGLPDDRLGQRIVLVLETTRLDPETEARLHDSILAQLDRRLRPREIIYRPTFAQTPTGKIDRAATLAHTG